MVLSSWELCCLLFVILSVNWGCRPQFTEKSRLDVLKLTEMGLCSRLELLGVDATSKTKEVEVCTNVCVIC